MNDERAYVDLHCHTSASFDSLARPRDVVRAAANRGLTHLAITDHDRIDGALAARDQAPPTLTVIVGEEVRSRDGDLICLFLEKAIPPGLSAVDTIAAARRQGGLVGLPHPFDRLRNSVLRQGGLASLAPLVDWVETYNARVLARSGNEQATDFALAHDLPGVSVSDAHSSLEIGVAYTVLRGDPSTANALRLSLAGAHLVTGRASFFVRAVTPLAKLVQRVRGNRRITPPRGQSGSTARP